MVINRKSIATSRNIIQATFLACLTIAIAGCGSSSSGGGGDNSAAPAAATVVSQGVVTAKGSVFVNGIEYSTSGAVIKVDDNPGVETDLKVGMVVKVHGTADDTTRKGTATRIEARDLLEGTISSVDNVNKTISVMGQTVRIEDNTTRLNDDDLLKVFANANFQVNDIVEVHGHADDLGGVRATRVLRKVSGEFETKGFMTALGATSFGLALTPGGAAFLTVNFSGGPLPPGTANGSFVEIKSDAAPVAGAVTMTGIHLEDRLGAAGDSVEVEGIVTSGTLASFVVNGQQVVTSASTLFEGGVAGDFAVGVKLEAEGTLNAGGAIAAARISFRSNIKIEGIASAVTATSLTVLGKTIARNQFTDGAVANTNHVQVRAVLDRNGALIATRIEQTGSTRSFLQGPVTAANSTAGTLTILGTTLVSDGTTEWRVSSTSTEVATNKADFFSKINVNVSVVKVRWDTFSDFTAPIKEAEIELGK